MFGKLFDFFIILGYERILCFEFKFIIFKFQNYLIYLKIKSTYNIICFSRPKPKKGPKLEKTTTQKYLQLFWRFNPKYFHQHQVTFIPISLKVLLKLVGAL